MVTDPVFPPTTFLGRLAPGDAAELLQLGVRRKLAAGVTVIREGHTDAHVALIEAGMMKVSVLLADGREALVDIRIAGDLIGEISALNGTPRTATVTTSIRSSIRVIRRADFQNFLRAHADAAILLAAMSTDRQRNLVQQRADFAGYPVRTRLARVLADLARDHGVRVRTGVQISVPLTQTELAGLCGATEVSIQRALRELRDAGAVDTGYRQLTVTDVPGLRRIADLP